ncbi:helix-turn-helix domain-containing protein [Enterococcus mundtii]|uniref:helix-turn-helix domain-containing protein n=1 Tax=Enterococcus TaxID=1350 RepID=UPI0032DF7386
MDLNYIYGKNIRKKIMLIQQLYTRHGWITTSELTYLTQLERKTVLKYIAELSKDLENFNNPEISITISKGRGNFLYSSSPVILKEFLLWLIKDNLAVKLFHTFFFEGEVNITKWSYDNYVSVSTVRRTLSNIEKKFKNLNIKIVSKKSLYSIKGQEQNIRYMYFSFFWNTYNGISWPFKNISEEKIKKMLSELGTSYSSLINFQMTEKLAFFLAVNITRFLQNNKIIFTEKSRPYYEINNQILNVSKLDEIVKKYFLISNEEISFWLIYFQTKSSFYRRFIDFHRISSLHHYYGTEVVNLYEVFKTEFLNTFNLDYHSLSEEKKSLFDATAFAIHYKTVLFPNIKSNPIDEDKEFYSLYPNLIKKIRNFCEKMAKITYNNNFLNNNFLIKKYTLLYELFYPLYNLENKISIYFETDYPYLTNDSLKKKIEKYLKINFNIDLYSAADFTEDIDSPFLELQTFDLIITTSPTTIFKNIFKNSSVIYIQYQNEFSDYDIHTIYSKVKELATNQSI